MTIIFSFICLLVLAPLGLSWMSVETYRDIWTEIGTALGVIGFSALLTLFLLSGRVRWLSQSLNIDLTMRWHRWLGFLVLGAAFLHPFFFTGSLAGGERPWDPTRALTITTAFAPLASGIAAFILIPAFIMLAIWHSALGYRYETWRRIHALGGCLFVLLLLHHTITAGRYGSQSTLSILWIGGSVLAILSVFDSHVIRNIFKARKPWSVTSIQQVAPKQWLIGVSPKDGKPLTYQAGQFAWLTIGQSAYSMHEHPFSISSAPSSGHDLSFLIKELGDFTSTMDQITLGTKAYVNGPYGHLTVGERTEPGVVMIAGGVGIAPMLSIIRELKLTHDPRPILLIYGNRRGNQIVNKDELDAIDPIYVVSEPDEHWRGQAGVIDTQLLDNSLLPEQLKSWLFVLCGPPLMLETVESYLKTQRVPETRILSERFNFG